MTDGTLPDAVQQQRTKWIYSCSTSSIAPSKCGGLKFTNRSGYSFRTYRSRCPPCRWRCSRRSVRQAFVPLADIRGKLRVLPDHFAQHHWRQAVGKLNAGRAPDVLAQIVRRPHPALVSTRCFKNNAAR